jgi:fatty-acyl-CoA synthase
VGDLVARPVARWWTLTRTSCGPEYLAAFSDADDGLVILAERATGTGRSKTGSSIEDIRAAVLRRYGLNPTDVRFLPAGAIPRTTSGKLARRCCRRQYLDGTLKG